MRNHWKLLTLGAMALWNLPGRADEGIYGDPPFCRTVAATREKPIAFGGHQLTEIPDITAPDLRLANRYISRRCYQSAAALLNAHRQEHPEDYRASYVAARLEWTTGDESNVEGILSDVLKEHQDFASGLVLLAGWKLEQGDFVGAARLLDQAVRVSPDDLWLYVDRLRIQASLSPPPELAKTLLAIAQDGRFPPNARETAAELGKRLPNLSMAAFETFYRAELTFESGTPMPCKYANLAGLMSAQGHRYREVQQLLESPGAVAGQCQGLDMNRMLLAESYLLQAAELDPKPSPRNAELRTKASVILRGDLTGLADWVMGRPQEQTLRPFLATAVPVDAVDANGNTRLCSAVTTFSVQTVNEELNRGADPNGRCNTYRMSNYILHMATDKHVTERQAMLRALLGHGGKVEPKMSCNSPEGGDCYQVLRPILEEFGQLAK
jgi:tetratricopeptide (TPR) repeat protein